LAPHKIATLRVTLSETPKQEIIAAALGQNAASPGPSARSSTSVSTGAIP
jgi:hypothetical protein